MTPNQIVLVGSPDDAHVAAIARGLEDEGAEAIVVNTYEFPQGCRVSLGHGLDSITVDGRSLSRPAAVYVRDVYATPLSPWVDLDREMEQHWRTTLIAMREKAEVLFSLLARWFRDGGAAH